MEDSAISENQIAKLRKFIGISNVVITVSSPLPLTKENLALVQRKMDSKKVREYHWRYYIPARFYDLAVFSSVNYKMARTYHNENLQSVVACINMGEINDESQLRFKVCGWDYLTEFIKSLISKHKGSDADKKSENTDSRISPEQDSETKNAWD